MSYCKLIVIANLSGRRPVLQKQGDTPYCVVDAATNSLYAVGSDEARSQWFRIKIRGKQAETVVRYHAKGKEIYVEGILTFSEWTDDNGRQRETKNVSASVVIFTGSDGMAALLRESELLEREEAVTRREEAVKSAERRLQQHAAGAPVE